MILPIVNVVLRLYLTRWQHPEGGIKSIFDPRTVYWYFLIRPSMKLPTLLVQSNPLSIFSLYPWESFRSQDSHPKNGVSNFGINSGTLSSSVRGGVTFPVFEGYRGVVRGSRDRSASKRPLGKYEPTEWWQEIERYNDNFSFSLKIRNRKLHRGKRGTFQRRNKDEKEKKKR